MLLLVEASDVCDKNVRTFATSKHHIVTLNVSLKLPNPLCIRFSRKSVGLELMSRIVKLMLSLLLTKIDKSSLYEARFGAICGDTN